MLISVLGFWTLYFGADADAQPHHHLHIATAFMWMGLLLYQLSLIAGRSREMHRKVGLAVLDPARVTTGSPAETESPALTWTVATRPGSGDASSAIGFSFTDVLRATCSVADIRARFRTPRRHHSRRRPELVEG